MFSHVAPFAPVQLYDKSKPEALFMSIPVASQTSRTGHLPLSNSAIDDKKDSGK